MGSFLGSSGFCRCPISWALCWCLINILYVNAGVLHQPHLQKQTAILTAITIPDNIAALSLSPNLQIKSTGMNIRLVA